MEINGLMENEDSFFLLIHHYIVRNESSQSKFHFDQSKINSSISSNHKMLLEMPIMSSIVSDSYTHICKVDVIAVFNVFNDCWKNVIEIGSHCEKIRYVTNEITFI